MNNHSTGIGRRRVFAASATALTAALALTACGDSDAAGQGATDGADGIVRVAYIGSKTVTFQNAIFEGLSSVKGIKPTFIESGFDVTKQVQAIQNAVASGDYDGIVLLPSSATGVVAAVNQAIDAGIAVFNVDSPMGPDPDSTKPQIEGQAGATVTDWTDMGTQGGDLAAQACKAAGASPCQVARIGGLAQFAVEGNFDEGMTAALDAADGEFDIVTTIYAGGYDANSGLKAAQDLLAANPDVDVILASDPVMKGVEKAAEGTDAQLIGYSGTTYGMQQVVDGKYSGEVALFPRWEGQVAGESIVKHVADPDLPADNPSPVPDGQGRSFTKENAASFAGEYE